MRFLYAVALVLALAVVVERLALREWRGYRVARYEATLLYTRYWQRDSWWSAIPGTKLILGALPLENLGHREALLRNASVRAVLSVVEDFETERGLFNEPVSRDAWHRAGVEVLAVRCEDFRPVPAAQLERAVAFLRELCTRYAAVYVHCKAGRGRSAAVVLAYMMRVQGKSFAEAYALVKSARPAINLNNAQRATLREFHCGGGAARHGCVVPDEDE